MATKKQAPETTETTEGPDEQASDQAELGRNPAPEPSSDVPKLADKQAAAIEEAEAAAKNPPDLPEPGTTEDTAELLNTDEAKSLSPNVTVSGTKPDGKGGYELLDTVNPAVANAGILPPRVGAKPQSPSVAPEDTTQRPGKGEVLFETTADNRPFWSGNGVGQGGPLEKGQRVVLSKEEADLLVQTKAGHIVESGAPASDENAKVEGNDV